MGFKKARAFVIEALQSGRVRYEERVDGAEKNWLAAGQVDNAFVIRLLRRCAGWEYTVSPHHSREAECHIFTPSLGGMRWYVKVFEENEFAVFISVHP